MNDIYNKFLPERKEEFLKWVMLTQPKDNWTDVMWEYMHHYQLKNWYEGINFIIKWTDNPSWAAYRMMENGLAEPEWAMKVIENATAGDPSNNAYMMLVHGHAPVEWAMKVIENAKTGYPSVYAYWMVKHGHTNNTEWAMRIIENAKTGNPSGAAYWMVKNGYASQEWYNGIWYNRNFK